MDVLLETETDGGETTGNVSRGEQTSVDDVVDENYDGDGSAVESGHLKNGIQYYSKREDASARLFERLRKACSKIRFLYAFLDDNHVHVIHDCMHANSVCRCFKYKLIERRTVRKRLGQLTG